VDRGTAVRTPPQSGPRRLGHLIDYHYMKGIYLDYNATTPVLPEVAAAMMPFLCEEYGNASSIHRWGQRARAAVEQARESVALLLGGRPSEVVFTSGGTESDNLAIFGAPRGHVVTSAIEHHAVLNACEALERDGIAVTYVPVGRSGVVDPAVVASALRDDTALISVMLANNETGAIQPIEEIARLGRERGILVHTDAVQAAGKLPIDARALGVDLLSISGHKIYAPKGVGALWVRKGVRVRPQMYGGRHERERRAGTENVPGIVAMGLAADIARRELAAESARIAGLRDRLEHGIFARVPDVSVNGDIAHRVPNTTNLTFDGIEGEALVIALDLQGISGSTGAACSSGAIEPSHVLTAMGLPPESARATLRISLGKQNTEADVDRVLEVLPGVVARLRALSPVYREGVYREKAS
jgi:cysteine desulfurase